MAVPLETYLEVLPQNPVKRESDLVELQRGFQQATVRYEEWHRLPWGESVNFRSATSAGLSLGRIDRVWETMEGLLKKPFDRTKAQVEATYTPESLIEMLRDARILEIPVITDRLSETVSKVTAWGLQRTEDDPYVNLAASSGLLERIQRALEKPDSTDQPAHFRQLLLEVEGSLAALDERHHAYFRDLGYRRFIQDQPVNLEDHMVRTSRRSAYSRDYCEGIGSALLERGNTEHAIMYFQKAGLADQEIEERLNAAKNHPVHYA